VVSGGVGVAGLRAAARAILKSLRNLRLPPSST
jgi:hypothetical protein